MDFVFTVCDQAAGEVCLSWPGQPITAHWGFMDPAAVTGDTETQRKAFSKVYIEITNRLQAFLSLPIDKIDRASLQNSVRGISQ
ncbi:MAG: hypothetical protein VB032_01015 [Burkholderiaceae bacterium]|nr:hypothetical protein [Burkholderiaceae bacterium]